MKYAVVVLNPHHRRLDYPPHLRSWEWDYAPVLCHLFDTEEDARKVYQDLKGVGAILAKVEDIADPLGSMQFSA